MGGPCLSSLFVLTGTRSGIAWGMGITGMELWSQRDPVTEDPAVILFMEASTAPFPNLPILGKVFGRQPNSIKVDLLIRELLPLRTYTSVCMVLSYPLSLELPDILARNTPRYWAYESFAQFRPTELRSSFLHITPASPDSVVQWCLPAHQGQRTSQP